MWLAVPFPAAGVWTLAAGGWQAAGEEGSGERHVRARLPTAEVVVLAGATRVDGHATWWEAALHDPLRLSVAGVGVGLLALAWWRRTHRGRPAPD